MKSEKYVAGVVGSTKYDLKGKEFRIGNAVM